MITMNPSIADPMRYWVQTLIETGKYAVNSDGAKQNQGIDGGLILDYVTLHQGYRLEAHQDI